MTPTLEQQLAATLAARHEAEAKLAIAVVALQAIYDCAVADEEGATEWILWLSKKVLFADTVAAFLDRVRAEGAAEDSELLNWFDRKDRSAHQDGDRWAIWLNTAENSEPISTVGDLRTALRKARAAELEAKCSR